MRRSSFPAVANLAVKSASSSRAIKLPFKECCFQAWLAALHRGGEGEGREVTILEVQPTSQFSTLFNKHRTLSAPVVAEVTDS